MNMYHYTVFVGWEFGNSIVKGSGMHSLEVIVKILARPAVTWKLCRFEISFLVHSQVVLLISSTVPSSWAWPQTAWASLGHDADFPCKRQSKRVSRWKQHPLQPRLGSHKCHFCHWSHRSVLLTMGGAYTRAWTPEAGIFGSHLGVWLPHISTVLVLIHTTV